MTLLRAGIPSLLPGARAPQSRAILGAMKAVALAGGPPSVDDRLALASADKFIFGHAGGFDFDAQRTVAPRELATALSGSNLAENALKFITVMAFVDGRLDQAKIAAVLGYAWALGVSERYIDEIREAAQGHLQEALADMTRSNMESITGKPWAGGDVMAWLLPYKGGKADPAMVERFEALGRLPADTFGHALWQHFNENGYAFPGDPRALNAAFCVPHDSAHVLSRYDTSPRGELLVSTFTAAMHPHLPMAGHVLPVIFSWHLKVQINDVAGQASGALDPQEFWHAWAGGDAATVDTFDPGWKFWEHVETPLAELREYFSIPAAGLDRQR